MLDKSKERGEILLQLVIHLPLDYKNVLTTPSLFLLLLMGWYLNTAETAIPTI